MNESSASRSAVDCRFRPPLASLASLTHPQTPASAGAYGRALPGPNDIMNRNMAILFSNATVLPMTAAGNAPAPLRGWVGVDGQPHRAGHGVGNGRRGVPRGAPRASGVRLPGQTRDAGAGEHPLPCGHDPATQPCRRHRPDGVAPRLYLALRGASDSRRCGAGHDARRGRDAAGRRDVVRRHVLFRKPLRGDGRTAGASAPCWAATTSIRMSTR